MPLPRCIKDLSEAELDAWLAASGQPAFRRRQLEQWLYQRWAASFNDMTNIPAALREQLSAEFTATALDEAGRCRSQDETTKFLFRLEADDEHIETVHIPATARHTVCISTQVGCPVRCVFCASGRHGLRRDLTPAEMVDQVLAVCRFLGRRVDNVVVMGIGEPLLNVDNLIAALDTLCCSTRTGIGARHITVSTSGIVPGIRRLADAGRQWNLALSLHACTDAKRSRLIPDRHRYPLSEILEACRFYRARSGRMVTLEYALIAGRTDTRSDMEALADMARELHAKVNLIPCNSDLPRFRAPAARDMEQRVRQLDALGVRATLRRSRGSDIKAACGQLRLQGHA